MSAGPRLRRARPHPGGPVARAYRMADRGARALPEPLVAPVAEVLGTIAWATSRQRRRLTRRHQQRVRGARPPRGAVRRAFVSYARYWLDAFRLPAAEPRVVARTRVVGLEHLDAARAAGRGVVLAVPHTGCFDAGGVWLARQGYQPVTVMERLRPPELGRWFAERRRSLGIETIEHGPDAFGALQDALRAGRTVALVADRDLRGRGARVRFFGEATTLPTGPARLALATGAPLLTGAVYRERDGHLAVIGPPIPVEATGDERGDVERITQGLADAFERHLRAGPEQWHLMQPNWPSDREPPPGRRRWPWGRSSEGRASGRTNATREHGRAP